MCVQFFLFPVFGYCLCCVCRDHTPNVGYLPGAVDQAYTVEEVRERQAELSKMRALMFYQERKQHHMNKIKSKVLLESNAIVLYFRRRTKARRQTFSRKVMAYLV